MSLDRCAFAVHLNCPEQPLTGGTCRTQVRAVGLGIQPCGGDWLVAHLSATVDQAAPTDRYPSDDPDLMANNVHMARARYRLLKSRTKCSLYGPRPKTHECPERGSDRKNPRGQNSAHAPSEAADRASNRAKTALA